MDEIRRRECRGREERRMRLGGENVEAERRMRLGGENVGAERWWMINWVRRREEGLGDVGVRVGRT